MRILCSTSSTVMPCALIAVIMLCHVLGVGPRQSGGRLVEQQQSRLAGERARQFQDLHLAEAQRACLHVRFAGKAEPLEDVERSRLDRAFFGAECPVAQDRACGAGVTAQMPPDHDVFQNGHLPEDLQVLKGAGDAELGALERRQRVDAPAVEYDMTRSRARDPRDHVEQRALAGAVRSDHRLDLAGRDVEAQIGDGTQPVEIAVQRLDLQERRAHVGFAPLRKRQVRDAARTAAGMPARPRGKTISTIACRGRTASVRRLRSRAEAAAPPYRPARQGPAPKRCRSRRSPPSRPAGSNSRCRTFPGMHID